MHKLRVCSIGASDLHGLHGNSKSVQQNASSVLHHGTRAEKLAAFMLTEEQIVR
jgi:hypothetical protein